MDYRDEREQAEAVKKWLREYGPSIVGGAVLGVAILFGWRAWQDYRQQRGADAAQRYALLVTGDSSADKDDKFAAAREIINDYASTPYATDTALLLAKWYVEKADYDSAAEQLRWVTDHGVPEEMRAVARLRLGRVLTAKGDYDGAVAALDTAKLPDAFLAAASEIRGDAFRGKGDAETARREYRTALDHLTAGTGGNRDLLEMKLDSLGRMQDKAAPGDATKDDSAKDEAAAQS